MVILAQFMVNEDMVAQKQRPSQWPPLFSCICPESDAAELVEEVGSGGEPASSATTHAFISNGSCKNGRGGFSRGHVQDKTRLLSYERLDSVQEVGG